MRKKHMTFLRIFILLIILAFSGVGISNIQKVILGNVAQPGYKTLTIVFTGEGTGQVTASPGGTFTSNVSLNYPVNSSVDLTALASGGSIFTGWVGECSGTEACSVVMNANKVIYAVFFYQPNPDCLWAWFRHNEGSGTTIIDYSPLATNGYLHTGEGNPVSKFWSVPGFGHNDYTAPTTWVYRNSSPRPVNYVSIVGFFRPRGYDPNDLSFNGCAQLGEGGSANWLRIGWSNSSTNRWKLSSGNIFGSINTSQPVSLNTWAFVYAHGTPSSLSGRSRIEMWIRFSGGSLTNIYSTSSLNYSYTGYQGRVFAFGSNNYSYNMDGGDIFYYACNNTGAILSIDQINSIYDAFKSRYGMN